MRAAPRGAHLLHEAFLREFGGLVRAVVSGGHTGIQRELMERLPALQVVAVNGVGTDAVDLAIARSRGICAGDRYVREGQWGRAPIGLARRFSGMRVGIVGLAGERPAMSLTT